MTLIRRALLVLVVLAAPGCLPAAPVSAPAPAVNRPVRPDSGDAARGAAVLPVAPHIVASAAERAAEPRAAEPAPGERRVPAQVLEAERREAGPLLTTAIVAIIAAGAFAVFLLLAHVNC